VGLKLKIYYMWKVYLIIFVISGIISYLWVQGIDNMKNQHPDYKGKDFLNFEEDEKETNDNK